jgi:3-hydroxyisobutyrate dehydrogenase-like beta-hydroxyacid dehydrogenase
MAERLLAYGCPLTLWNCTRLKAQSLGRQGAQVAATPAEAAGKAADVLLVLKKPAAIRQVLLELPDKSVLAGRTTVQLGTIGVDQSQALASQLGQLEAG